MDIVMDTGIREAFLDEHLLRDVVKSEGKIYLVSIAHLIVSCSALMGIFSPRSYFP